MSLIDYIGKIIILSCCLAPMSYLSLCDPKTVAHQAPLSMGFPRQEYWSELPFSSPGDLSNSGINPVSPAFQVFSLPPSH